MLSVSKPTAVEIRWPPTSARGCAGSASGVPITRTIDVANGTNMSGKAVYCDSTSMAPIAIAPPAAPAMT